jgi:pimeloyl-[acyl-carrier protein] synthase
MIALSTQDMYRNPYPTYHALRKASPAYQSDELGFPVWYVTGYEEVEALLKDPRFIREIATLKEFPPLPPELQPLRDMLPNFMLFRDPPVNTRLRGLVSKAFTPKVIERLRPHIEEVSTYLLQQLRDREEFDLMTEFAYPLPFLVITEMLGVPAENREFFKLHSNQLALTIDPSCSMEDLAKGAASAVALETFFKNLFEERRREPKDDMISDLLCMEVDGDKLTEDELVGTCVMLMVAGHETSVHLIGNGLYTLLAHPEQWKMLRENPSLAASAVEEILRYEAPIQMTFRFASEDFEFRGVPLPKAAQVAVCLGAANRDPKVFPNPDVFDITRTPNRHLSFGSGPHFCLGAALARIEGELALQALVRHLDDIVMLDETPNWRPNVLFRGLQTLRLKATIR